MTHLADEGSNNMVNVSFELFPTEDGPARAALMETARELAGVDPAFVTVTYGASGTSRDRTLATIAALTEAISVPVAGHLTTQGATKAEIHEVIDAFASHGVDHIVALRGDPPAANGATPTAPVDGAENVPPAKGYETAADLVQALRARPDGARFEISVAAYPEIHPKAASPQADLDNLKAKIDAGADRAITQFFFDPELFLRFRDQVTAAGIGAPLVPGIMPITNLAGITRMAGRCGAHIPAAVTDRFEALEDPDDAEARRAVAAEVAAEHSARLRAEGVTDFHFYTMNRPALTLAACAVIGRPAATPAAKASTAGSSPS